MKSLFNITEKRRSVLVELSNGDWSGLADHSDVTKAALQKAELIRCDFDEYAVRDRIFTITPDGQAALENLK